MAVAQPSDATLGRALMREAQAGALATIGSDGCPFASHVLAAPAADGSPILLLSRLAVHSQNLARDPRASLLFVRQGPAGSQSMAASRLTLTGRASKDEDPALRRSFLARHPDAAGYAGFADFAFYRFHIGSGHLVAGFGRIVDLTTADLLGEAEPG